MDLITTYASLTEVTSTDLNAIQARAAGLVTADGAGNRFGALPDGVIERFYQGQSDLATGTLIPVDGTIDARDRVVRGDFRGLGSGTRYPGGTNDYLYDAVALTSFLGYFGRGAVGAANAAVVNGTPPVPAAGASWAAKLAANLWLYCDPSTGAVSLYNDTGSAIASPTLWLRFTAKTGQRP